MKVSCLFGVSNSWKWWNSGGFVWPGMTDGSAAKIGHCPPLSFIMSVGQVWWREPGSWECRSFIQNEDLYHVEISSSTNSRQAPANLVQAYTLTFIWVDCKKENKSCLTSLGTKITSVLSKEISYWFLNTKKNTWWAAYVFYSLLLSKMCLPA